MHLQIPNKLSSSLSRFGVLTEGSGSVRFRINTTVTDPRMKDAILENYKKNIPEASKTLGKMLLILEL